MSCFWLAGLRCLFLCVFYYLLKSLLDSAMSFFGQWWSDRVRGGGIRCQGQPSSMCAAATAGGGDTRSTEKTLDTQAPAPLR